MPQDRRQGDLAEKEVPIRVMFQYHPWKRCQLFGVQFLANALSNNGQPMLETHSPSLQDGALQDPGDILEAGALTGKLLWDEGQRGTGGLADAEGQMSRLAAHGHHEEPPVCSTRVLQQVQHQLCTHVPRCLKPKGRHPSR